MSASRPRESPEQTYDSVATQRLIRHQISRETEGMTYDDFQRYIRARIVIPFRPDRDNDGQQV